MMRSETRIRGYTLVELMVVISIIGILVALTAPAVQVVRQRMLQAECAENLRQIAIAARAYETSKGSLPGYCHKFGVFAGGVDPSDPGSFSGNVPRHVKIGGWHVALLGHLDQQPIYEHWSRDRYPLLSNGGGERGATREGYSKIAASNLRVFQCRSASGSLALNGLNNYIANTGMHVDIFPFTYTRPGQRQRTVDFARSMALANGVFNNKYAGVDPTNPNRLVPVGKRFRSTDFKDGRSNTMMFTESIQAQPWHLTSLSGNTLHLTNIVNIGRTATTRYPIQSRYLQGAVWHFEDDLAAAGASTPDVRHKINGGQLIESPMTSMNYADVARPSSFHIGGVNMAMADGSVRFVADTIDYRTYQALLTPSGRSSDVPANEFFPFHQF